MTELQKINKEIEGLEKTSPDNKHKIVGVLDKLKTKRDAILSKPKTKISVKKKKAAPKNSTDSKKADPPKKDIEKIRKAKRSKKINEVPVSTDIKEGIFYLKGTKYKVKPIDEKKKQKSKAKVKLSVNREHSKKIAKRTKDVFRPVFVELSKTKTDKEKNTEKLKKLDVLSDLMTIFNSELDVHTLKGSADDLDKLIKLVKGLILTTHENSHPEKYCGRPEIKKIVDKYPDFFDVQKFCCGGKV